MSESGVIPRPGERPLPRLADLVGTVETDEGIIAVHVRGTGIRISGDVELDRDNQEEFAVIYVRACWQAGENAAREATDG